MVPETTNLFTLILAIALFGAYGVTLAIGWAIAAMVAGTHQTRWLWPDAAKGNRYRIVALVNVGLAAVAIAGIYLQNPTRAVLIAAAAVAAAIVANYLIVTSNRLPLAERPIVATRLSVRENDAPAHPVRRAGRGLLSRQLQL